MTKFDNLPPAQQAGILSNDTIFWRFAGTHTIKSGVTLNASASAEFIRTQCGINSRAILNTDPAAAERFAQLRTEFDAWRGRIATPR